MCWILAYLVALVAFVAWWARRAPENMTARRDIRMTGAEIREIRRRSRMTQRELGELIGVAAMTVSRWELDQLSPYERSCALLRQLADLDAPTLTLVQRDLDRGRPLRALALTLLPLLDD